MAEANLVLYSTLGCHLCEQAETLLLSLPLSAPLAVDIIDIGDDDALVQRYGSRIPVLGWEWQDQRDGDQAGEREGEREAEGLRKELDWPFDTAAVLAFIRGYDSSLRARPL